MRTNYVVNSGVRFQLLSQDQLQELFDGVLHLLEYTGLDVYHDEGREILKEAGAWVDGLRVQQVRRVRFCLAEMGLNAIEWGSRWDRNLPVEIDFQVFAERLCVTVRDRGQGFDPSVLPHVATLDNPDDFRPQVHVFFAERISWLELEDDLPRYEGLARGAQPLGVGPLKPALPTEDS